jgi:HAD superfamily hydrolase (TIGR01459 family)
MESSFQVCSSCKDFIDLYDGFILDQYGVLHNGLHPLQGAVECVEQLAQRGKKLIILSNSPFPGGANKTRLIKLGFDVTKFVGTLTSGDEAISYIASNSFSGQKALFLTYKLPKTPSPVTFLEACGNIQATDQVEEADFVLLHGVEVLRGAGPDGQAIETSLGSFHDDASFEVLDPILQKCRDRNLPMLCCNPDFIAVQPDGSKCYMPGTIGQRYEELGGSVVKFGKPNLSHFEACLQELGLPKHRVAHVGDSLHHDVAGANAVGIASVLVVGGVHREELQTELGVMPTTTALQSLFHEHSHIPTHVVPMFRL